MPLTPPPVDQDGEVVPHDHAGITDEDIIIRRIGGHEQWTVEDKGIRRLSSIAFKVSSRGRYPGLSVDLAAQIVEAELDPRAYVISPPWVAAICFCAGDIRQAGYRVGSHPLHANPYHGEVWGPFKKGIEGAGLRDAAKWYVELPGVQIAKP